MPTRSTRSTGPRNLEVAALTSVALLGKRISGIAKAHEELAKRFSKENIQAFSEKLGADAEAIAKRLTDESASALSEKLGADAEAIAKRLTDESREGDRKTLDAAAAAIQGLKGYASEKLARHWKALEQVKHLTSGVRGDVDNLAKTYALDMKAVKESVGEIARKAEETARKEGPEGPIGPMPKHQVKGGRIRFEKAKGKWGPWVPDPASAALIRPPQGGGSSGGIKPHEVEKLICSFLRETTLVQDVEEYSVTPKDRALYVRTTTREIDIYLPDASRQDTCPIEIKRSEDSQFNVRVHPFGGQTIEGEDCRVINVNRFSLRLKISEGSWKEY